MAKTIFETLGFDKCYTNNQFDLSKASKIYLNLIKEELKSRKENNITTVKTNVYDYIYVLGSDLSGEEKLIRDIVESINKKYNLDKAFKDNKLNNVKPLDLLQASNSKELQNTFYNNMNFNDAVAIFENKMKFYSTYSTLFNDRQRMSEKQVDKLDEQCNLFLYGAIKELERVHKSKGFFYRLMHRAEYKKESEIVKVKKINAISKIFRMDESKITDIDIKMVDQHLAHTNNYTDIKLSIYGFDVDYSKMFALKSLTDNTKSREVTNMLKDYVFEPKKELGETGDTPEPETKEVAKKSIEVNEVKTKSFEEIRAEYSKEIAENSKEIDNIDKDIDKQINSIK